MGTFEIAVDRHAATVKAEPLSWTKFYNTIDGKLESTADTHCSINPATEENNPQVPLTTKDDIERAMLAASVAFKTWSGVPYAERQRAVLSFADALIPEKEPFSKLLTQEQGKPVSIKWLRSEGTFTLTEMQRSSSPAWNSTRRLRG